MGSAVGRAGMPLPYMASLSSLEVPTGAPAPQSQGCPVLGHTWDMRQRQGVISNCCLDPMPAVHCMLLEHQSNST